MKPILAFLAIGLLIPQEPIEEGNRAYREGRFGDAVSHYQEALAEHESPAVYLNLAHARFELGQWTAAIEAYRRSGSKEALRWIARCHLGLDQLEEAEHALLGHLVLFPDETAAREQLAQLLSWRGGHGRAAALYRALLREHPGHAPFYRALAAELHAAGRDPGAIDALEAAWRLGERDPELARLLGDLYLQQGMHQQAAEYYQKLLVVAEKVGAEDCFRIGYVYYLSEEHLSARKFFQKALEIDATYAKALLYLGNADVERGRPEKAIEEYRAALASDPELEAAHVALANLLLDRHKFKAAASSFAEAIRLGTDAIPVHYNRIVALARSGRKEDAAAALKEALHRHPSSSELRDLLKTLLSAGGRG
ncbi:MAG: tetratricopeptide repeat protein [Planctomycetota bacterium]